MTMLLGTNTNSHVLSPVQELARVWDIVPSPGRDATYHIIINSLRDHSPCTPPLIFATHPPIYCAIDVDDQRRRLLLPIAPDVAKAPTIIIIVVATRDDGGGDGVAVSHPRTPRLVREGWG